MKLSTTILGSAFAFLLATSCCWMPALAFVFGSSAALAFLSNSLGAMSSIFFALGVGILCIGVYKFWQKRKAQNVVQSIDLQSIITCPNCGFARRETMPTDACQFFYECTNCKQILKPKQGDCCVYCSFGTVKCPPIQTGKGCC
jgi:hypothetical protein